VKNKLEITLQTIHLGSARRIVTLAFNGKDVAYDFLSGIEKFNSQGFKAIKTRMRVIAENLHYENQQIFRNLGNNIYEIKIRSGLRLYVFLDQLDSSNQQLVIATCGGKKNTKKEQSQDIRRAQQLRDRYLQAKDQESTLINLIKLPYES